MSTAMIPGLRHHFYWTAFSYGHLLPMRKTLILPKTSNAPVLYLLLGNLQSQAAHS
jgi:hypothetical protein